MPASIKNDKLRDTVSTSCVMSHSSGYGLSSAIPMYLALPRLRAFWPFSSTNESDNLYDLSGQGRTMTNNNTVDVTGMHGIVPYANFIRANSESFSRADETGLSFTNTVGMVTWCWFDAESTGNNAGLINKWYSAGGTTNNRSYTLYKTSTDVFRLSISDDGINTYILDSTVTYAVSGWYFVAAACYGNSYMKIFVNGTWVSTHVGVPVSIYDNDRPLYLGAYNEANYLDGRMTLTAIHKLPAVEKNYTATIESLYQHTRALFGRRS
jgi:hypothetical protein